MNQLTSESIRTHIQLTRDEKRRLLAMFGFIALLHVAAALLMWAATSGNYKLADGSLFGWGTAALAYTLGMRHAFDADHISAIDDTTRLMLAKGKKPMGVGLFFSLGHSTIVLALSIGIAFAAKQAVKFQHNFAQTGGIIGASVSAFFLYLVGILNLIILVGIIKVWRQAKSGQFSHEHLNQLLNERGLFNRIFRGFFKKGFDHSWQLYPIGVLFGLGFDTATEVGLLVLAGSSVIAGLPWWAIISLPLFFAGGMSLLDTIDGSFMNFAYGWAFSKPVRKVYYNIVITALSVGTAMFIGALELSQVISQQLELTGGYWDWANNINLNSAGYIIVATFAIVWAIALLVWRYGKIEDRWHNAAHAAQVARGEQTDHAAAGITLGEIRDGFKVD